MEDLPVELVEKVVKHCNSSTADTLACVSDKNNQIVNTYLIHALTQIKRSNPIELITYQSNLDEIRQILDTPYHPLKKHMPDFTFTITFYLGDFNIFRLAISLKDIVGFYKRNGYYEKINISGHFKLPNCDICRKRSVMNTKHPSKIKPEHDTGCINMRMSHELHGLRSHDTVDRGYFKFKSEIFDQILADVDQLHKLWIGTGMNIK